MELKLEVQLSGNALTFSLLHLGCLNFLLLWLALEEGWYLLHSASVVLSEENILIADGENKGRERKQLTQHLTVSPADFKALSMGLLRVVQEAG